jgi:hypothetical protein
MAIYKNPDGTIAPFTPAQIAAFQIECTDVRYGEHSSGTRAVNASTIEVEYLIAGGYSSLSDFVTFMCGASDLYTDGMGVTRLTRLMPQTWPFQLGEYGATKISKYTGHQITGQDNTSAPFPIPTYTNWRVKVLFEHLPFNLDADFQPGGTNVDETRRYVQTLPSSTQVDHLTLPGGILNFKQHVHTSTPPDGTPIPYNVGMPLITSVISRKWIRLPFEAWGVGSELYDRVYGVEESAQDPYLGTINQNTFLGYEDGTLLFMGVEEEIVLDPNGNQAWNLTFRWMLKPQGHNWFWWQALPGSGLTSQWLFVTNDNTWHTTATTPDGTSLFNVRDHSALFRVGA